MVYYGLLPFTLNDPKLDPLMLMKYVRNAGCNVVILDSVKDTATALTEDRDGNLIHRQMANCIDSQIEVGALHHDRKEGADGKKTKSLDDMYGSRWLTAGVGSVVYIMGEPGAKEVDLLHLKQPKDVVGPLHLLHQPEIGKTVVTDQPAEPVINKPGKTGGDGMVLVLAAVEAHDGVTAQQVAEIVGLSQKMAGNYLNALLREGRVRFEKADESPLTPRVWYKI